MQAVAANATADRLYCTTDIVVVSPNDLAEEIEARVDDYLRVGVQQVWVLYPGRKSVYVYRHDGTARRLTITDDLSGETVPPGFACRVADLFADV